MNWIRAGNITFNLANITFIEHGAGNTAGKLWIHWIGEPINELAPQPKVLEGEDAREFMRQFEAMKPPAAR